LVLMAGLQASALRAMLRWNGNASHFLIAA
jgi:hypothetical protein